MSSAPPRERSVVSINQASTIAGVSRRTIYKWIQAQRLEYIRTAGGAIRIFEDTLWRPGTPANTTP